MPTSSCRPITDAEIGLVEVKDKSDRCMLSEAADVAFVGSVAGMFRCDASPLGLGTTVLVPFLALGTRPGFTPGTGGGKTEDGTESDRSAVCLVQSAAACAARGAAGRASGSEAGTLAGDDEDDGDKTFRGFVASAVVGAFFVGLGKLVLP